MKKIESYKDCVVYLVDDDIIIRDSVSVLIESTGLIIKCFESAEDFLNNYIPDQPGCLILDVRMPIMNGLELQEELSKRNIQIPIIFISGNAEIPDSAKAFRAGAVFS
jgi:FixJ family two-component response regulator